MQCNRSSSHDILSLMPIAARVDACPGHITLAALRCPGFGGWHVRILKQSRCQ